MHAYIHIYIQALGGGGELGMNLCSRTHRHVRTYIHTYLHTYMNAYRRLLAYVHTYIHTYILRYIHECIQALAGGGARGINFNELAGDLALITFKFPFKIPPYFALIIRAIGQLVSYNRQLVS